ncbi:Glutamine-dependent NAD(+) synthetase [Pirellula sp. SH-Sr6A]|uniref:NAD(+) synthase n=1 Tax=Pirellula sp. SH-Sr6A TaxID=1632865 RepID=UPI00078D548A|nr:NAD(+) synthase [Pirellula sp. SH-Sr6A]AMV33244.1 Glutamine-dependent NAD(+) synthetase [Pirellula sp. SH-Sr6A]
MTPTGFLRVTTASAITSVGNPHANRICLQRGLERFTDSDIVLFGELCLSGYTCGELFRQSHLLDRCRHELFELAATTAPNQFVVVGLPWVHDSKLLNCAAVLTDGRVIGLVPKQHLPTYQEFYEGRWFHSGQGLSETIRCAEVAYPIPLGCDLLFQHERAVIGIEICEDLWVPIAPSAYQSIAGANVLLNLSASNETVGKAVYRKGLVATQSGKCNAAYCYASAGPSESTTDLVFSGHCLIAETGSLLAESKRIGTGLPIGPIAGLGPIAAFATADIDLDRIEQDRRATGTMHQRLSPEGTFRRIPFALERGSRPLQRWIDPHPFVPKENAALQERCDEIFEIQIAALAKRVQQLPSDLPLVIGVSGGLDSTLATLVAAKMLDAMGWSGERILGITMPGFGTSDQTRRNALDLIRLLGLRSELMDIRASCFQIFQNLNHAPFGVSCEGKTWESLQLELEHLPSNKRHDLVFENVQARMRTLLLMSRGFVIGTGDLSESALGWSTYNADHMSMYNVNCSVPKTLVRFLVRHVAHTKYDGEIRRVLLDIAETPISPELLPLTKDKTIEQSTEATVGPYELHDFFLYHFVRTGAPLQKIRELARAASFDKPYTESEIDHWLDLFLKRFFAAQFKRTCVPDGPKVGTVSLSPRGDWRMPTDADPTIWREG